MFSRRAEAHDRKDTADCRPVHISAYHEHKKGGKQAIDPHIKDRSCPALSLKKVGSRQTWICQDPAVGFPQRLSSHSNCCCDHSSEKQGQKHCKEFLVALGPDQP